jgi:hypothetical protein
MSQKQYVTPDMEVTEFEAEDVITTSGDPIPTEGSGDPDNIAGNW